MNADALSPSPGSILDRAVCGDVSAFSEIATQWVEATVAGKVHYAEGIVATGFWQRLVAATGDGQALFEMAEVLLAHRTFAGHHDREARAIWLGAEAIRRLEQSAEAGNEAATTRLVQVSPTLHPGSLVAALDWRGEPYRTDLAGYDRTFAEAAAGSVAAVAAIYQNAVADVESESIGVLEGLVLLEGSARLGAASGDRQMGCHLGEALMWRDRFDRQQGVDDPACTRQGECLSILIELTRGGSVTAAELLATAVDQFPSCPPIDGLLADARNLLNPSRKEVR